MESVQKKDITFWKVLKILVPLVIKSTPIYFTFCVIIGILQAVTLLLNTIMTQKFFDNINKMVIGSESVKRVLISLCLLAVCMILVEIVNGISNFSVNDFGDKVNGEICKMIHEKLSKLNPIDFENPLVLDDINKAKQGSEYGVAMVSILIMIITFYIPYFIFMTIYLYNLKPILAVSIVLIFVPVVISQIFRLNIYSKLEDDVAPLRRKNEHYEKCIIDRAYYKETRVLGAFSYFKGLYIKSLTNMNKCIWKTEKKSSLMEIGMKSITLLGYISVLYLLIDALLEGTISVGAFSAVFASISTIIGLMEEVICNHIGLIAQFSGTVKNLVRFFDIPERVGKEINIGCTPEIELQNVYFKYPEADKNTLEEINLCIKPGETIAIVGENGAGKSTLTKLLAGIYIPTQGKTLINNNDVKEINPKALFKEISAVFQKFQKYKMTLGENVCISDAENEYDNKEISSALLKADFVINKERFPNKENTMLAREFDGVDISGGQWQRVAIARGFYKTHSMIVLDEPTAAIDPVEETKLYKKFEEMAEGKTAIIVTHRLGSAKIADRIIVMDKGKIIEIGTHNELMKVNGKYREMYEAQSQWYSDDQIVVSNC